MTKKLSDLEDEQRSLLYHVLPMVTPMQFPPLCGLCGTDKELMPGSLFVAVCPNCFPDTLLPTND